MARVQLKQGDRVSYWQNGLRLKARVADFLPMKTRGEEWMIPVVRRRAIQWKKRGELRKLPDYQIR